MQLLEYHSVDYVQRLRAEADRERLAEHAPFRLLWLLVGALCSKQSVTRLEQAFKMLAGLLE